MFCQPDSLTLDQYLYNLNNDHMPVMSCCVSDTYQGIGFGDAAGYLFVLFSMLYEQKVKYVCVIVFL